MPSIAFPGGEECDDGNEINGDGCAYPSCSTEFGWACDRLLAGQENHCVTVCGDGIVKGLEPCDDGNLNGGDGCHACEHEAGWDCTNAPQTCNASDVTCATTCVSLCGDGIQTAVEDCDDGNHLNDDGCSSECVIEEGWNCFGGSLTQATQCGWCGDGLLEGGEACDDNNTIPGDGCSANCTVEPYYRCLQDMPVELYDACNRELPVEPLFCTLDYLAESKCLPEAVYDDIMFDVVVAQNTRQCQTLKDPVTGYGKMFVLKDKNTGDGMCASAPSTEVFSRNLEFNTILENTLPDEWFAAILTGAIRYGSDFSSFSIFASPTDGRRYRPS